jgi:enoyl-CoA hydratase/carnithine racemase
MNMTTNSDLRVSHDGHVAIVEICRAPHNFFDLTLIRALADTFKQLEDDPHCRAIVLASEGTAFCAGANFTAPRQAGAAEVTQETNPLYAEAIRLFSCTKPVVAAVHGAAVGGGLGLALVADFRVSCAEARFTANFSRLGFHPGFGLSLTLPRLVGHQAASLLFYTGRRIGGEEAMAIGLIDVLVAREEVRSQAIGLALEIAVSAPLAIKSIKATLQKELLEKLEETVTHESVEQARLFRTEDFEEGIAAMSERRLPQFQGT